MPKSCFDITITLLYCQRSRTKVGVKVMGRGQISAADIRAESSKEQIPFTSHYQSKVFVCVFVIRGHTLMIVRMWSISFY